MFRKDEFALVLDFLPSGRPGEARQEPTVQVIGDHYFTLLELISKPGAVLAPMERVYIGAGVRDKIERIKARIKYDDLTNPARQEVERAIRHVLKEKEQEFVSFFNKAGPINIRIHALELLPGIGKKNLESLLLERDKGGPFQSLEDVRKRVPHLQNLEDVLVGRIISELKADEKYYLFVKIPPRPEEEREWHHHGRRDDDRSRFGGERRY